MFLAGELYILWLNWKVVMTTLTCLHFHWSQVVNALPIALKIADANVDFKVDSEADCNVISQSLFDRLLVRGTQTGLPVQS